MEKLPACANENSYNKNTFGTCNAIHRQNGIDFKY